MPAALAARQARALIATIARGLAWGLPAVGEELRAWRAHAAQIADQEIRGHALSTLDRKRSHAAGAALFAILPRRRDSNLLRLLVAYETLWDYLDTTNERAPEERNGRQLHLALIDAIDPSRPQTDCFKYHPWDDGGYLHALVACGRGCCMALPSHSRARQALIGEARRAQVLALNHETHPCRRDEALRNWAATEAPAVPALAWYELSGAGSASLTVHALLALAAQPGCSAREVIEVRDAYNPWISAATTMLDSFVDQLEDATNRDHSYVAHYPSHQTAIARTRWLIEQSIEQAQALPRGERHQLIVAAMAAMYLSKDSARSPALADHSRTLARASGALMFLLLPLLRLWRTAYHQRAA